MSGQVYVVDGVRFDGYNKDILMEAKGPDYKKFIKMKNIYQR